MPEEVVISPRYRLRDLLKTEFDDIKRDCCTRLLTSCQRPLNPGDLSCKRKPEALFIGSDDVVTLWAGRKRPEMGIVCEMQVYIDQRKK